MALPKSVDQEGQRVLVFHFADLLGENPEGIRFYLERPSHHTREVDNTIEVSGWVFAHQKKVEKLLLKHALRVVGSFDVSKPRPDVTAHFHGAPHTESSGFAGTVELSGLPDAATLQVEVVLATQERAIVGEISVTPFVASNPSARDSSQHGEVELLAALLGDDCPKYLVDVGAHDGQYLSNSYRFVEAGWNAILLEPLPSVFKLLTETHAHHANAICLNKACSEKAGKERFFIGADGEYGMNSTLCQDDNKWFAATRTDTAIDVEVATLTELLDEHRFPCDFSLLLVDTEGMDYEVLTGLDFSRYRPRVIVTEEYMHNQEKHERKYQLLSKSDYTRHCLIGCNSVWVRNELT